MKNFTSKSTFSYHSNRRVALVVCAAPLHCLVASSSALAQQTATADSSLGADSLGGVTIGAPFDGSGYTCIGDICTKAVSIASVSGELRVKTCENTAHVVTFVSRWAEDSVTARAALQPSGWGVSSNPQMRATADYITLSDAMVALGWRHASIELPPDPETLMQPFELNGRARILAVTTAGLDLDGVEGYLVLLAALNPEPCTQGL